MTDEPFKTPLVSSAPQASITKVQQQAIYQAASNLQTAVRDFIASQRPDPNDVLFHLWRLRRATNAKGV